MFLKLSTLFNNRANINVYNFTINILKYKSYGYLIDVSISMCNFRDLTMPCKMKLLQDK